MTADLADVLGDTVRELTADLAQWEPRVRADEADSVHQMRVAARTLRSVVQVYGSVFEPAARTAVADALRRIGGRLAPTRDAEVIAELVDQRLTHLPPRIAAHLGDKTAAHLRSTAIAEFDSARTEMLAAINSAEHREDRALIESFAAAPHLVESDVRVLAKSVQRRMAKLGPMTRSALAAVDDTEHIERLHKARKEAKRIRYAATAVQDVDGLDLGKKVAGRLRRTRKLQAALGDHRDCVMVAEFVLRAAERARAAGEDTFGYGLLYAQESAHIERLERTTRHLVR